MSLAQKFWPGIMYFWAILILIVSVIPGEELPSISIWEPDKIMHALVYGILTFLLFKTFVARSALKNIKKPALIAFCLCILYGFIIELIQLVLPERMFDMWDELANATGCAISLVCISLFSGSGTRKVQE